MVWRAGPVDRPAPSTWGEGAGSMGGQAGTSQRGSERELDPHTTRYSCELGGIAANLIYWTFPGTFARWYTDNDRSYFLIIV